MDKLQQSIALAVAGSVTIMGAGYFLLVSPKKSEATDLRAQAVEQVSANEALETQLTVLRAQAKELPAKQADLARVAALVPDNPSLPALIRALSAATESAGVEFVSIKPSVPEKESPVAPAAAPVEPAPAAAQSAPGAPAPPAPDPAGNLVTIPVELNVVGDYFDIAQFVENAENLPRAMRFVEVDVAPDTTARGEGAAPAVSDGRRLLTVLRGQVYMAVNRPAPAAVVAPVATPVN